MSIYDKASLVLIPSGTKTSKVYSQKPTNGDGDFTFSRSTAATRVNASGNIEKETSNLLLQSNSFNTTWVNTGYTLTSGQSDRDGGTDAWLANCTAAGNALFQSNSSSGVLTFSIYAKEGTQRYIRVRADLAGVSDPETRVDLNDGSIDQQSNVIDVNVTDVGNDYYRIEMTFLGTSLSNVQVRPVNSSGGNVTGNFYIQDAQLNQGLIAQEVLTTTTAAVYGGITDNTPRLDYTDSSCPSLKLEPQRTNLVPFSEHLESSDWSKTRCTIEDNSTTSPEGVINASKMTSTDASESYIQDNLTTTGTKLTWSFFAKKGDLDYAHGLIWDLSANGCRQWFNLSTGAVGGTTTFGSGYSVDSATIEDYGNGWYRCAMVVNSTAGTQGCRVNISSADTTISSAVNSYGYFYGIQLEDASYETSYIPTYGSAVTRNEDSCIKTGVSSLLNTSEGSIFLEINTPDNALASKVFTIGDSTANRIQVFYYGDSIRMNFISGGTTYAYFNHALTDVNDTIKVAIAYATNDIVMYVNGALTNSDNGATMPSVLSYVKFDNGSGGAKFIGKVNQALLFKTRLTNAELATLTTI